MVGALCGSRRVIALGRARPRLTFTSLAVAF
jgi:hypothetical protein